MQKYDGSTEELLQDIADFSAKIERFLGSSTQADFMADEMMRWAVAKCIEAIGEAAGRIVRLDPAFAASHPELLLAEAYRMRNRLTRGYGSINWTAVWATACDDVPELANRIRSLDRK